MLTPAILARVPFKIRMKALGTIFNWSFSLLRGGLKEDNYDCERKHNLNTFTNNLLNRRPTMGFNIFRTEDCLDNVMRKLLFLLCCCEE